ncbi:hypothetical protein [uncultured Mitsuokella sp.]|uniref:hypothetical protein n=1 Tax=uncultured Mitsuokella sp. TaxID=453120 RepID=UPI002604BF4F|nr:hypothetical protein [uncultured Mitsuokella sp.]
MEYLCKFGRIGNRKTTVISGVHYNTNAERQKYIDDGYIPISDEDYQHYIGNRGQGDNGTGYIRDAKTGKPVSAPPAPPVKAEPEPIEPEADDVRLAAFEAMAAQEERMAAQAKRIAELETMVKALKGGEGK